MKFSERNDRRIMVIVLFISFLALIFGGCANVQHQARFNKEYIPKENVSIKVAEVVNDTGFDFDIDIEDMLADALEDQLLEEDLLWLGGEEPFLLMESRIIGYKKGSAFKRWMMPGWGATELSIRCELNDNENNVVGKAVATREVFAGGGYTIGAWKTVFKDVANDVAEDLRAQIESLGYVIQPKTMPLKATESPVATFSPAKVDPTEPWTGEWEVEGFPVYGGIWRMKQTGMIVKSTKGSMRDFKGKVKGNQLKGRLQSAGSATVRLPFVIKISSDGLSFEGIIETPWRNGLIKGKRKTGHIASADPVNFNSAEPWTGVWNVQGHIYCSGRWSLVQTERIVKSTKDSTYEIKGKTKGNQLKGRFSSSTSTSQFNRFTIKLSSDGLSFYGSCDLPWRNNLIMKGQRITSSKLAE